MSKPKSALMNDDIDLANAVEKGTALPDMIRKKHIYDAHKAVSEAEKELLFFKFKNPGVNHIRQSYNLRVCILECWRMIDEMVYESEVRNFHDEKRFEVDDMELMTRLYSSKPIRDEVLHHLVSYLDYCLHKINITNLLREVAQMEDNREDTY